MYGKPMRGKGGGRIHCFVNFCSLVLLYVWIRVEGWGRKSYWFPAEISSFLSRDLSRHNEHDSFWLVVSTGYFYILFLWAIVVSDFLPMEIHKHLVLPSSSITFTTNSQGDNHFYIYAYLFQILCTVYSKRSVFYFNTR